jgi:hypothetical protein
MRWVLRQAALKATLQRRVLVGKRTEFLVKGVPCLGCFACPVRFVQAPFESCGHVVRRALRRYVVTSLWLFVLLEAGFPKSLLRGIKLSPIIRLIQPADLHIKPDLLPFADFFAQHGVGQRIAQYPRRIECYAESLVAGFG